MTESTLDDRLHVRLLGAFELRVGTVRVSQEAFRLRKAKSLLKLLALAPDRRLHRARVGELLWPERDVESVANNLNQAVFVARRALDSAKAGAGSLLMLHDDSLSLGTRASSAVEVDVDLFRAAAVRARELRTPTAYAAALELYGGELLPEDSSEHWSHARRQALKELHVTLLLELSDQDAAEDRRAAAIQAAQQAVLESPLHEGAHRALMRRFVDDGRRQQALEQYAALRELLKKELEAKPDPETRRLYHEILTQPDQAPQPPIAVDPSAARAMPARNNLPLPLTSFIGRERERQEVLGLVARSRLVTLTGPGGCGKTRLSLEVSANLQHELENGVLLVELAPVTDPTLVAQEVATALGIELRSQREPAAAVAEEIGERSLLLLLDNCEHVLASCAQLVQKLLHACSQLRVLATSREPLHVLGEITFRVPSLALPDAREPFQLEQLAEVEAVRLFVERASSVVPNFRLEPENAAAIAQVCLRLDGMPLAIELAAARASALSPAQIAERLRDSFAVLGQGNRGALSRQQTLVATISWSYDLLETHERTLFRRLALFAGSFSLEAVESICADAGLAPALIADLLGRLVDKSLVLSSEESGQRRYRLLETVKQYGVVCLNAAGEQKALAARLVAFYLAFAAANDPELVRAEGFAPRLERDHDNLRAALAIALVHEPETALQLCAHQCAFWMARGYFVEGTRWLDAALAASSAKNTLRARALLLRAGLAVRRGQVELICASGHQSIAILSELRDQRALADAQQQCAMLHLLIDQPQQAEGLLASSQQLAESLGDRTALAAVRHCEGVMAYVHADYAHTCALFREAYALFAGATSPELPVFAVHGIGMILVEDEPGRPRCYYEDTFLVFRRVSAAAAAAWTLANLSDVLRSAGQFDEARAPLAQALALFEDSGDKMGAAMALNLSGNLARSMRDFERGRSLLERAITLRRELRDRRGVGLSLVNLALLEARTQNAVRSQSLLGQAHDLFTRTEDMPGLTQVQMARGSIALAGGAWDAARAALETARTLASRQGYKRTPGWLSLTLAEGAFDHAQKTAGQAYLADAKHWFESSNDTRAQARIVQLSGTEPS